LLKSEKNKLKTQKHDFQQSSLNDCGNDAREEPALHDQVDAIITRHRYESLLAFTDRAVNEFGRGSSAVVMLPLELGTSEIEVNRSTPY